MGSLSPDGEYLEPDPDTVARRQAIAATLVALGFISAETAQRDNPAVEVLAALLPSNGKVGICLSCHEFKCSGAYPFGEATGLFGRPTSSQRVGARRSRWRRGPPARTEIVLCTQDALCWTRSQPLIRGARVVGDEVTLYSVQFSAILGATVHDQHKGALEVWLDARASLSFQTTPGEVESLCSHIERAAATSK
jgi:hypothetical protein